MSIPAARVELTTDVAELKGRWARAGELSIGTGRLMVCDLFIPEEPARLLIEWPTGRCVVEVFESLEDGSAADCLGLRLRPPPDDGDG